MPGPDLNETREAARAFGLELAVREASSESELDAAFANFDRQRNSAIFLLADGFFRNATRSAPLPEPLIPRVLGAFAGRLGGGLRRSSAAGNLDRLAA